MEDRDAGIASRGNETEEGTDGQSSGLTPQEEAVKKLWVNYIYKITYQSKKNKVNVTGKFIGINEDKVLLQDQKGLFRNVVINSIIRINYFKDQQPW